MQRAKEAGVIACLAIAVDSKTAADALNPDDRIVLYCYKGKRSLQALEKLREAGFSKLHSLAGGIDRWAEEVDPEMPRY